MKENKPRNNIRVYKKRTNVNIGILLFGVILFYLLVTILSYMTSKHVSVYEVREGSILKDNSYTGVILREETVVNAEGNGYINFFATEGNKIGKLTDVYSLSTQELSFEQTAQSEEEKSSLSSEEQNVIIQRSQAFVDSYRDASYEDTYQYKDSVESTISTNSTQSRQAQLQAMIDSGKSGISVYKAADDGIVIYSTDDYETMTLDQLLKDMISRSDYQKAEIFNNSQVSRGDSIYKIVTDEDWLLAIELDEEMAETLAENTRVRVRFKKDNEIARAAFEMKESKEHIYGILSFDHSMVRYAGERFLDIELIIEDESGLKIPKSSVVEKEFYLVPEEYITQGGNSNASGVLVKDDDSRMEFVDASIYYMDDETGMVYVGMDAFKKNAVIIKPDSTETYTLSETGILPGVYNINKGYAVFKHVNILCESDEYYIVEQTGNVDDLTNYDHIALDGDSVNENDVVF